MNLDIIEMEAAQLVRALEDVDMAVINGKLRHNWQVSALTTYWLLSPPTPTPQPHT